MSNIYKPGFARTDIEIIEKNTVFDGHFQVEKYSLRHRLFNGGWSKPLTRELFERGDAAAVLLFDPALNKLVLVEQFRMGALHNAESPWLLELVAGVIEPNESAEQVVRRESEEEAGLKIHDIIPIYNYWVSAGACTEKFSLFCARVDASTAGGIFGLAEEGEDIRVWVFSVDEVYAMLAQGQLNNAMTLIAVQWFKLNEAEVRARWSTDDSLK